MLYKWGVYKAAIYITSQGFLHLACPLSKATVLVPFFMRGVGCILPIPSFTGQWYFFSFDLYYYYLRMGIPGVVLLYFLNIFSCSFCLLSLLCFYIYCSTILLSLIYISTTMSYEKNMLWGFFCAR